MVNYPIHKAAIMSKSTVGRSMLDDEVRARFERAGGILEFHDAPIGWFLIFGAGTNKMLASGPVSTRVFGAELFRKMTGRDIIDG